MALMCTPHSEFVQTRILHLFLTNAIRMLLNLFEKIHVNERMNVKTIFRVHVVS